MWTRLALIGAVLLYATGTVAAGVPVDPDDGVGTSTADPGPDVETAQIPNCDATVVVEPTYYPNITASCST